MFQRIRNLFGTIFGIFVTRAETAVPLEERLKYDRERKGQQVKDQMNRAANIGALANMAVADVAELRSEVETLRLTARDQVRLAQAAAARGDTAGEEYQMDLAAQTANEMAEAQAELATLEQDVRDALKNKEAAKRMVFEQADQLQKLARDDQRLVRRHQMTQMAEQSLALTEELAHVVPDDGDNMRDQMRQATTKRAAAYEARKEIVEGLVERQQRRAVPARTRISAAGRDVLAELQAEVGYTGASAAAPAPRATAAPAEANRAVGRSADR